jgi:acyl-CoA thioesterase-1
MGTDRSTLKALLWLSASALQLLPREQPLTASRALMRKATKTLVRQYNLDRVLLKPVLVLCLYLSAYPGSGVAATLLVMGDSLSAAYGIKLEQGWVALLQARLNEKAHQNWRVINASISGETSNGGKARLSAALEEAKPDIVLLGLGSNDGLMGRSLRNLKINLNGMIEMAGSRDAKVLLLGSLIPPNYGTAYTTGFARVYTDISSEGNIPLVPFLLEGVATDFDLMQNDGLHPTAAAQPRILDNVWPYLEPML